MSRPLPLWRSLRLRIPVLMSGVVALVLIAVFWMIDREIQKGLMRAGTERAQAASEQLTSMLAQASARGTAEVRRVAADPAVQRYLEDPSSDASAARDALKPLALAAQPTVELRTADGERVLSVEPARGKTAALEATVPLRPGLSV